MKLTIESDSPSRDLEALAKARVNRKESKVLNTLAIVVGVGAIIGVIACRYNGVLGWGLAIIGMLPMIYYGVYLLPKKQKAYANELWSEYQKDNEAKQ